MGNLYQEKRITEAQRKKAEAGRAGQKRREVRIAERRKTEKIRKEGEERKERKI